MAQPAPGGGRFGFLAGRQRALVLALAIICFLGIVLRVSNAQTSSVNSPASLEQLFQQQRWHDVVREAEAQDVRSADVEYYYGTALAQLGRWDDAAKAFRRGLRLAPDDKRFPI